MNPIVGMYKAWRHVSQLNAHIKLVVAAAAQGSFLDAPAVERFLDWIETNPSVEWILISEFDDKRPYTRDDLKSISLSLMVGGVRIQDIVQTLASPDALRYVARATKRKERHDVMIFTLREHWEDRKELPLLDCPSSDKLLRIESIWKRGSSASAD